MKCEMIRARAVVDIVKDPLPNGRGLGTFKVEVWGDEPHDFVRLYEIQARSDTMAAQEGISRFVNEMEERQSKGN